MLVIGPNGEQLGVKMRREALEIAYEYEMDLFCVAPQGNPDNIVGSPDNVVGSPDNAVGSLDNTVGRLNDT